MEDCPLRVCTRAAHSLTDFFWGEKSIFCTEEVEGDVSGEGKHSHQKNRTPQNRSKTMIFKFGAFGAQDAFFVSRNGAPPTHLIKKDRKIECNKANYVPFVVPGLSTSS